MSFESDWQDPPREFSLMPFWFWNDALDAGEIVRQIESFERNGVYGFVIHPRVGLPRDCGWMSDKLLGFYRVAIEEAARRDMRVMLYDEGMYPSGSSCGQLVDRWPDLACRGLALHDADAPLPAGANVVQTFTDSDGRAKRIVDRPIDSVIRGLHYVSDGPAEDEPRAGDILNPRTAAGILELVHEKFYAAFGEHFGKTIIGVFTDEPNPTGRSREKGILPGTTGILPHVSRLLGHDFEPHLPALFQAGEEGDRRRSDYKRAVRLRLEETWYKPLSDWCAAHDVALCGHPDAGDEIGVQRHFQIPGQDLVWRWVLPDHPSATQGPESTQGKCSASAMVHAGRRRNSNEFAGAYGHETTFEEVKWLARWCLIRGVNLLIPHAFYYSVRGPRRDERPPQLGPHTPQWDDFGPDGFKAFADECRRLCWLNTDCRPVVDIAILTHDDRCPWRAAEVLLTHQRDFLYIDPHTLLMQGEVKADGLRVGEANYAVLVVEESAALSERVEQKLRPMAEHGRVVRFEDRRSADELVAAIDSIVTPAFTAMPYSPDLRLRTLEKAGRRIVMAFNESLREPIDVAIADHNVISRSSKCELLPNQFVVIID